LVDLAKTYGGAEVRILTTAVGLQTAVAHCRVATLEGSALHARLQAEGIPCEVIRAGRASPRMLLVLRAIIRRGHYQIVDAHNVQSIFWSHLAARLDGAKGCVTTIHSDFGKEYPGFKGCLYECVLRLDRLTRPRYINVTDVLQAKATAQGLANRSSLISNAIPVPATPPAARNEALRAEWDFAPGDFVVGIVARLKPVKGHKYLIEALAQLADLPHVKLLILGEGPLRHDLEVQARDSAVAERVHFAGFREDIPRILPMLDCLCMASLSEALPFAILEGAANALPILATEVGGMATLLTDYKTARLVPAQNSLALSEGLRWMVNYPVAAHQMGLAAYDMVKQSFGVDKLIEKTLQVYDQVLSRTTL
jgi:glycosyltransferase involved in cell wall biosynthesis